ncbi:hypothetical protein M408DRAFT_329348, partial [Serendipita vermifera MAFF 305830]
MEDRRRNGIGTFWVNISQRPSWVVVVGSKDVEEARWRICEIAIKGAYVRERNESKCDQVLDTECDQNTLLNEGQWLDLFVRPSAPRVPYMGYLRRLWV